MIQKELDRLTLFDNDVLIEPVTNVSKFTGSFFVLMKNKKEARLDHCRVIKVGSKVTEVNVGDVIAMSWTNMTIPFYWGGQRVAITDQYSIEAVIDNVPESV